jgi:hypothetical protein
MEYEVAVGQRDILQTECDQSFDLINDLRNDHQDAIDDVKALSKALRKMSGPLVDPLMLAREIQQCHEDWKLLQTDGRIVLRNFTQAQDYANSLHSEINNLLPAAILFNKQLNALHLHSGIPRVDNLGWTPPSIPDSPTFEDIPKSIKPPKKVVRLAESTQHLTPSLRSGRLAHIAGLACTIFEEAQPPSIQRFPPTNNHSHPIDDMPIIKFRHADGTIEQVDNPEFMTTLPPNPPPIGLLAPFLLALKTHPRHILIGKILTVSFTLGDISMDMIIHSITMNDSDLREALLSALTEWNATSSVAM